MLSTFPKNIQTNKFIFSIYWFYKFPKKCNQRCVLSFILCNWIWQQNIKFRGGQFLRWHLLLLLGNKNKPSFIAILKRQCQSLSRARLSITRSRSDLLPQLRREAFNPYSLSSISHSSPNVFFFFFLTKTSILVFLEK